jgi:hypothetical protein
VDPYGTFNWAYWSCDSHDCHYYFGYIRDCYPTDINHAGVMVGASSMPGSGTSSLGVVYHAFISDPAAGVLDPFPDAMSTQALCINNRGEIGGYMYGDGSPVVDGFRLLPDGTLVALNRINASPCVPRWINARGQVIGACYPSRSFVSPSGATTLLLPTLGGHPRVQANDLNDQGWIVGWVGPFNTLELYAVAWEPLPNGTWQVWDLTEELTDHSVILDQALAINNRGEIIALGHLDGTDAFSSRTYLLSPVQPLPGWCLPDIGRHPRDVQACGGGMIEFTVGVVNAADVTGYQWRRDGVPISPSQNPTAATPVLQVAAPLPGDSADFDCVITSACGSVTSASARLSACCAADIDQSGVLNVQDLFDFLAAFFAGDPAGDFDHSGALTVQDVFDFLAAFFAGCP